MKKMLSFAVIVFCLFSSLSFAQKKPATFRVGAAKVDVSPLETELPPNMKAGIHDRLYSRAIVIDNGSNSAALVTVDSIMILEPIWQHVTQRIEKELGIPAQNVFLTATHDHSATEAARNNYEENIFQSVKQAKQKLQPARIGYGTGVSYININRTRIDPKTRLWAEGPNYDAPSDKTVAVITFESLNGEPIAVYYNYAVHAVTVGIIDEVSGEVPGATSRYIEESYDDKVVAVWSTGACGDQNPIFFQQTFDLREIREKEWAKQGVDMRKAMMGGAPGFNKNDPKVARLMNQARQLVLTYGQMLGEEVVHVMRGIDRTSDSGNLFASQKTVTCPGRERTNMTAGRAGVQGEYKDSAPVDLRLGLLVIGDIAIGSLNAEAFNPIATRLKRESPYARTMMVTVTNGRANSGYIPNDAAFEYQTFEVLSSRLKPGCAEGAIVNGILDMMETSRKAGQ